MSPCLTSVAGTHSGADLCMCFDPEPPRWGEIRGEKRESLGARCPLTPILSRPAARSTRRSTPMLPSTSLSSPGSAPSDGRWGVFAFCFPVGVVVHAAHSDFCSQTMSVKEKGKFEDMAKMDKVRYDQEMLNYIPAKGCKKKKKFKDPNAPKRPP